MVLWLGLLGISMEIPLWNIYIERDFTPSMWFWDKYFVDLDEPTDEEICMFDLQFGEGMYDKITGLSLYDYD